MKNLTYWQITIIEGQLNSSNDKCLKNNGQRNAELAGLKAAADPEDRAAIDNDQRLKRAGIKDPADKPNPVPQPIH